MAKKKRNSVSEKERQAGNDLSGEIKFRILQALNLCHISPSVPVSLFSSPREPHVPRRKRRDSQNHVSNLIYGRQAKEMNAKEKASTKSKTYPIASYNLLGFSNLRDSHKRIPFKFVPRRKSPYL